MRGSIGLEACDQLIRLVDRDAGLQGGQIQAMQASTP
jgi:hypothetical protein